MHVDLVPFLTLSKNAYTKFSAVPINPVGIRSSYFSQEWKTDFLIHKRDSSLSVCELVRADELTKATTLEQLELSRRYWEVAGVSDWRIVLVQEGASHVS